MKGKHSVINSAKEEHSAPEKSAQPINATNPIHPIKLKARQDTEKMKEITDQLERGIENLFESDRFKQYLKVMSKFHNYIHSFRFAQAQNVMKMVSLSLFFLYNSSCRELGILQITGR